MAGRAARFPLLRRHREDSTFPRTASGASARQQRIADALRPLRGGPTRAGGVGWWEPVMLIAAEAWGPGWERLMAWGLCWTWAGTRPFTLSPTSSRHTCPASSSALRARTPGPGQEKVVAQHLCSLYGLLPGTDCGTHRPELPHTHLSMWPQHCGMPRHHCATRAGRPKACLETAQ